jgi:AraC-like DNA-binding protein
MISFSRQAWDDFVSEPDRRAKFDPSDPLDTIWYHPPEIGRGSLRWLQLRDGLAIEIIDCYLTDDFIIYEPEQYNNTMQYHFHLWGQHQDLNTTVGDREFCIKGTGLEQKHTIYGPAQRCLEAIVYMQPQVFTGFIGDPSSAGAVGLAHLVQPSDRLSYERIGKLTPAIEMILWEILRCPFQGIYKRLFLEGKALELVSLVLVQEQKIWEAEARNNNTKNTRDRVHYARELLIENIHHPLTLQELAARVNLNEQTLKKQFKSEFGTTVFDYLLQYRLQYARKMLEQGQMSVSEVMMAIGLNNRSYFATAFCQKFGCNPKAYQQHHDRL